MRHYLGLMLAAFLALAHPAHAAPVTFEVRFVSVYDGDTFNILVDQLPAPLNRMKVRLRDIDTPERGSKAKCEAEAAAAEEARLFLQELLKDAKTITVIDPKWDKYGGRIDGDVQVLYGGRKRLLTDLLVTSGHARRYDGGQRQGWCAK